MSSMAVKKEKSCIFSFSKYIDFNQLRPLSLSIPIVPSHMFPLGEVGGKLQALPGFSEGRLLWGDI